MKRHRYKTSFALTALLYALPIIVYIYALKQTIVSEQKPREETIELSLSQFVPQPTVPSAVPAPVQEEESVEEVSQEEKKPAQKEPETKAPPKETDSPKRQLPSHQPIATPHKPKPVVKKKEIHKQRRRRIVHKMHAKKKVHKKRRISGGGTPRYSAAQKNAFLAAIRQKINRAKSYPRIAQRRGLQGVVAVRFTILPNGRVGNIVLSGPRIFYASARKAVKSAFPVNPKKATLRLPASVTLSLHYKLR